ncbi:MAG: ribonuclease R [Geminicoccaceae bacterium]|nr:MAG: ribonuclease R [Geminicoccaceae bacterium]
MARAATATKLPNRDELLRWIVQAGRRPRAAEIARAFGLGAEARRALRALLRELEAEGAIPARRSLPATSRLPAVAVVRVVAVDREGDLRCEAEAWPEARIRLPAERAGRPAPGVGDRLLARLRPAGGGRFTAEPIRLLPRIPSVAVGVVEGEGTDLRLRPIDRAARGADYAIVGGASASARPGELVRVALSVDRPFARPQARVVERIGRLDDPAAISTALAVEAGLPVAFPAPALALAAKARVPTRRGRVDLRDLPLVTIDGEDARDFDDAVFAAPDDDPTNPGGHRITVAIADVAWYVRPGDALDRAARERGNSVYFPDRAIPMLPEALSNDLCSLRPGEDRASLAAHLRIDARGRLLDWRFERALIRSRARLTYRQVQAAVDGTPDEATAPLLDPVLRPLFDAYAVLAEARRLRGTIDLDLPERKIVFDPQGRIVGVEKRERLAAHRLIEEFMILANVAAATVLEEAAQPCLFRVHDRPDPLKLAALADYLERIGVPWTRGAKSPADFDRLLARLADHALRESVAQLVLRCQAQAVYSPRNIGHFGLHLRCYAHFTSPIRRYADLVVHRTLVKVLGLGAGRLGETTVDELEELGRHLSLCERRAMECERGALERMIALHLSSRIGALFAGRVTGVQRFGLFVTLDETGADGLVPIAGLGEEYFRHDEAHHRLIGERSGESFGLGDRVVVELVEVDVATGTLLFRLEEHERAPGAPLLPPPRRGRAVRPIARARRGRR